MRMDEVGEWVEDKDHVELSMDSSLDISFPPLLLTSVRSTYSE